jgi:hypothetical protein
MCFPNIGLDFGVIIEYIANYVYDVFSLYSCVYIFDIEGIYSRIAIQFSGL